MSRLVSTCHLSNPLKSLDLSSRIFWRLHFIYPRTTLIPGFDEQVEQTIEIMTTLRSRTLDPEFGRV